VELLAAAKLPPPDYSKPLGEIYQELTVLMARTTGSLNVLIPAALSSFPDPGYPSWIPDWTAHFDALWTRPPRMWHDQDATPGSTAYWKVDGAYGQKLLVRGRRIAQVISCTRFHETKDPYDAKEKELHLTNIASSQILLDALSQLGTQSHTELNTEKVSINAAWSSWITNGLVPFWDLPDTKSNEIFLWFIWLEILRQCTSEKVLEIIETRSWWLMLFKSRPRLTYLYLQACFRMTTSRQFLPLHIALSNHMARHRRAFLLADPRPFLSGISQEHALMLATGTESVREDDEIVLISGVSSPMILRHNGESKILVSPAFEKSMMDGRLWKKYCSEHELEEFVIQ
jgi:hypothetical protein